MRWRFIAKRNAYRILLVVILLIGLGVRLPVAAIDFHRVTDVVTFSNWATAAQNVGLAHVYEAARADYPPVFLYMLTAAGWLAGQFDASLRSPVLIALVKLPSFLADIFTAALIAGVWRILSPRAALFAAAAYVLNPAVWYVSAYYGQTDSIYTLFLVVAVIGLEQKKLPAAWLGFVLALGTKLQSIALAPLMVVDTFIRYKTRDRVLAALVVSVTVVALLAPWLIAGNADTVVRAYTELPSEAPKVVVSAYNLWYLLRQGRVHEVSSQLHPLGLPVTYQTLGMILFAIFVICITGLYVRRRAVFIAAAALVMGLYMLLTQMHERYMFPVLAMLALAATCQPRLWWLYAVLSVTYFFNLITIAPFTPLLGSNLVAADITSPTVAFLKALALVSAAIHVAGLVAIVLALVRYDCGLPKSSSSASTAPSMSVPMRST